MKRGSTLFLKAVIALIALGAFVGLAWFPQTEGRAANLDLVSIYADPLILYIYIATLPFFVALYQAITLLGLIEKNSVFSQTAVIAVRNIKYCAFSIIGFLVGAMVWIRFFAQGDDPAGPIALGLMMSFAALVIATALSVLQRLLQNAADMQSERDLTV